jgi:hypothetical protein
MYPSLFDHWYRSLYRYGMHYVRKFGYAFSFDWLHHVSIRRFVVAVYRTIARGIVWLGELLSTLPPIALPLAMVAIFLSTFVYIKLRFPFWSSQPVFHTYDGWRYLCRQPYVVQSAPPPQHKHYDARVQTHEFFDLSRKDLKRLCEFMQCHWIPTDQFFFTVTRSTLATEFTGHTETPYVSIYWEPVAYTTPTTPASTGAEGASEKQIAGCIFSRPLRLRFSGTTVDPISLYYLDYFCMNREKPDPMIGRSLFQTHEYHQRTRNPAVAVSLFKKETDLCQGVVPLISYTTYLYAIPKRRVEKLPAGMSCVAIHDESMDVLVDFLQTVSQSTLFSCIAMTDISHLVGLVKAKEWFVFVLRSREDILAMYFFKNAHIRYESTDQRTLQLVASVCNTTHPNVFYVGFLQAMKSLVREYAGTFGLLKIEDVGHNGRLVAQWKKETSTMPIVESESAYYLYNYVVPKSPMARDSCLFLI